MNATGNSPGKSSPTNADFELAFDVGHSSIGWAVLQASANAAAPRPTLLGCGAVIFGADDCLASKRRDYRRQRRHARATRQRIARMEKLLAHLGVLTPEQLAAKHQQAGGHSAPWLLAARVLASNGDPKFLLDWPHLWDVLRWYAHNRGYDGNRRWSAQEAEAQADDTEKEKNAIALMEKHGTPTMAETFCKALGLEPLGARQASKERFKGLNAAFPREVVEREVRRLLEAHSGKLPAINDAFLKAIFQDWRAAAVPGLDLPKRYQGGLLFGQLVPRFDNRIISTCPISGEKVPSKNCPEFLRFRWAMQLANIRVAHAGERDLRPLSSDERKAVDTLMREEGSLTPLELKKAVREATGCQRDNLDTMLMHPDAKEALLLDSVQRLVRGDKLRTLWPCLAPRVQKRARDLWQRGKAVSLVELCELSRKLGEPTEALEAEVSRMLDAANTRKNRTQAPLSREGVMNGKHHVQRVEGRAAYARPLLVQAYEEVMAGKHPKEEGGCLFTTEEMRLAQLQKEIDQQTNNHLVRHRLLILERLLKDLIADPAFANGDKSRIARMTIEVNRDLREMAGMTRKAQEQDMGRRLANHHGVARKLEQDLAGRTFNGQPIRIGAGLIRKARVAEDLGWTCPYTGKTYDALDLVSRKVDKDHIIPRSKRPSDSLDSLVITFSEINRMKGQRTAWQFVKDEQGKPVDGMPNLSIVSLKRFEEWVGGLEAWKGHDDDKRRKKRRKELLLLPAYEEKEFVPRDLTTTSQLVRLGAQMLKRSFLGQEKQPPVISLPGSVTGTVRKGWNVLGCLSLAAPQILEADGTVKTKTEIRDLTHLHHALDACVLGLAAHRLPNNGGLWELMLKRNPSEQEKQLLRATGQFDFDSEGRFGLKLLPDAIKDQIRQRLAEKRVVQHIPADMTGLRVEENMRGVEKVEDGRVYLRQRSRDLKTGRITVKRTDESAGKVVGLAPTSGRSKLQPARGARVISDNFGVAILDHAPEGEEKFVIIPWHKVYVRIHNGFPARDGRPAEKSLVARNGGRKPRILRNGQIIRVRTGTRAGIWRVISIKNTQAYGLALDLSLPDSVELGRGNAPIKTLVQDGLEIVECSFVGVDASGVKIAEVKKRPRKTKEAESEEPCPTTSSA